MAKPTLVLRTEKGNPLTTPEMDGNLSSLRDATFTFMDSADVAYTFELNDTVDIKGAGAVTSTTTATGLEFDLTNTGVTPGTYDNANVTVDSQGRITLVTDGAISSTDVVPEGTANLYYTDTRVLDTLSANTVNISGFDYPTSSSGTVGSGTVTGVDVTRTPNVVTLDDSTLGFNTEIQFQGSNVSASGLVENQSYYVFANVGSGDYELGDAPDASNAISLTDPGTYTNFDYTLPASAASDGAVMTYNGTSGALELATPGLNSLTDVGVTTPAAGDALVYDGTQWTNAEASGGGGALHPTVNALTGVTGNVQLDVDANNLFDVQPSGDVNIDFNFTGQNYASFDLAFNNLVSDASGSYQDVPGTNVKTLQHNLGFYFQYDMQFLKNGTVLYLRGRYDLAKFVLSYPYDLDTATLIKKLRPGSFSQYPLFGVSEDEKYIICRNGYERLKTIELKIPGDISTSTEIATVEINWGTRYGEEGAGTVSPDGTRVYIQKGRSGDGRVRQYNIAPWDVSSLSNVYGDKSLNTVNQTDGQASSIFFNDDGTEFFLVQSGDIYQYTLSTPWELDTASYTTKFTSNNYYNAKWYAKGTIIFNPGGNSLTSAETGIPPVYSELTLNNTVNWDAEEPNFFDAANTLWLNFETADGGSTWYGNLKRKGF